MSYEIRSIQLRDVPDVDEIENLCFKQPWDRSIFIFLAEQHGQVLYINREINMLVVTHEQKVVAYIVWAYNLLEREGHIQNIAVDKGHRRRGIARALMNRVFSLLRDGNAKRCVLEVRVSNKGAQEFYNEIGMTPVNRHRMFYDDEDAIIYQLVF